MAPPAAPSLSLRRFTQDEYFRMLKAGVLGEDESTELLSGHVTCMSPQNAPHRIAVAKVSTWFQQNVVPKGYWVQTQGTLPLGAEDTPEPDLVLFPGTPDDLIDGEPDVIPLVVEVADTSISRDRTVKLATYAAHGIPEYWIVNLTDRTLEVYRDPSGDEYRERRTLDPEDAVAPQFDDSLSVDVATLLPPEVE